MSTEKTYKIGEEAQGGIVFYVYHSGLHGTVAALDDQGTGVIEARAIGLCRSLDLNGYTDWYLPSKIELNFMCTNLYKAGLGGFTAGWYWSSDADFGIDAWNKLFFIGDQYFFPKDPLISNRVRAVRAF